MVRSPTFYAYIVRQFLFWFLAVLLVLSGVIAVFEFVEFVRQVSAIPELPLSLAFTLAAFKLPSSIEILFHFAVLIAAMVTFWRMTRSRELVVARAAGLSAWQFLAPVIVAAMVLGVVKITVVNPISAAMYGRFERLDVDYLGGTGDIMKVAKTGFWLRQKDDNGVAVIHAERVSGNGDQLQNAMFLLLKPDESYRGRIDGASARLQDGKWLITDAWVMNGNDPPQHVDNTSLPSNLTRNGIQERFASQQTISFWDLPDYVRNLEATGFSSTRYRIAYQSLLSQPLLMAAMILVAAAFSLRPGRRVDTVLMIVGAIVTGFSIFVLGDIVAALGRAGTLPVPMAAWATSGVALLFGIAALLHLEDG
jgi:lipopolysaccharide export system permease protein